MAINWRQSGRKTMILHLFLMQFALAAAQTSADTLAISRLIARSQEQSSDTLSRLAAGDSALKAAQRYTHLEIFPKANFNKAMLLRDLKHDSTCLLYFGKAIESYDKLGLNRQKAKATFELATAHRAINHYAVALAYRRQALQIWQQLTDTLDIIDGYQGVAVMYWRLGDFEKADSLYTESLRLSKLTADTPSITAALNSLGAINWSRGRYTSALENYEEVFLYHIEERNPKRYALILNNIGLIYFNFEKYDKALENYFEGLKVAKETNYNIALAYSYENLGQIYLKLNRNKKALIYFDSALVYHSELSSSHAMSYNYRHIGDTYVALKDYPNAIKFYEKSIDAATKVDSKYQWANSVYTLAYAHFKMNNFDIASDETQKALSVATTYNYRDIAKLCYYLLSELEEKYNNPQKALDYYKAASAMKDSIFNEDNNSKIAEMQTRYETDKKQRENERLRENERIKNREIEKNKTQIRNQTVVIIVSTVSLVFFIIFSLLLHKNRKKLNQKTQELEDTVIQLKKATDFKNKLFAIIGHDLRGPIGTIGSIMDLALDEEIPLEGRNSLLRSSIDGVRTALNLLENLLAWAKNEQGITEYKPSPISLGEFVLRNIGLLHESAKAKSITFESKIDEKAIFYADYNMADTILRNLISNAVKFTAPNGTITISAYPTNNMIEFCVQDNGIGMTPEEINKVLNTEEYFSRYGTSGEKGSGIGLRLCFDFIARNKGTYRIESKKGEGSKFYYTLPTQPQN